MHCGGHRDNDLLFMNGCLAKYWEGMLISYLTTQDTYLPFTELEDLYYKTDYKVVVLPKSAYMQSFQIGNDLEKAIWKERIEPYMKAFRPAAGPKRGQRRGLRGARILRKRRYRRNRWRWRRRCRRWGRIARRWRASRWAE